MLQNDEYSVVMVHSGYRDEKQKQLIIKINYAFTQVVVVPSRRGTTSLCPEVHGEVLAVTTCHMIS